MNLIFFGAGTIGILLWGSQPTDFRFVIAWLAVGMICHGVEFIIWVERLRATEAATAPETPGAIIGPKD